MLSIIFGLVKAQFGIFRSNNRNIFRPAEKGTLINSLNALNKLRPSNLLVPRNTGILDSVFRPAYTALNSIIGYSINNQNNKQISQSQSNQLSQNYIQKPNYQVVETVTLTLEPINPRWFPRLVLAGCRQTCSTTSKINYLNCRVLITAPTDKNTLRMDLTIAENLKSVSICCQFIGELSSNDLRYFVWPQQKFKTGFDFWMHRI